MTIPKALQEWAEEWVGSKMFVEMEVVGRLLDELPTNTAERIIAAREAENFIKTLRQFHEDTMTLIIPDQSREQRPDFMWCLPVERVKWQKWYELASKQFKTKTPEGVVYMSRMEGKKVQTIMVLPTLEQSDDDAVTACAWLRLVKGITCKLYILRCTDQVPNAGQRILNAIGADPALLEQIDDENPANVHKEVEDDAP